MNVVLTDTLQMDCNERTWTGLLKRAQALPPSLVSAIMKHAAPLLATDQSGQVSFSLGVRGVIADNVAVTHVQDIRGVWKQRCEWVDGMKQGWCFERNDQGKTLTLYMKDNECNGYCLYKRNGDDQGVVDYVNGELLLQRPVPMLQRPYWREKRLRLLHGQSGHSPPGRGQRAERLCPEGAAAQRAA